MTLPPQIIDLSDLSIIIPFRWDSPDRLENLHTILKYFNRYSRNAEFFVLENGDRQTAADVSSLAGSRYSFQREFGSFHKTRILNGGVELARRKFVASYDADTLIYPQALLQTMELLRAGARIVSPCSGDLFDLRRSARESMIGSLEFASMPAATLLARRGKLGFRDLAHVVYTHNKHVGGAVFFERKSFLEGGGYNENIVSWGYEDNEIVERFEKLGIDLARVMDYPMLHLSHRRSLDSGKVNPHFRTNIAEYRRISSCTGDQILDLVRRGALKSATIPPVSPAARFESMLWNLGGYIGIK